MVRTARDALVTALENLARKGLKKFRNKLNDWPVKEGFNRIPRGQLEDTDPDDVANKIRDFYTFPYGIRVALAVLEAIDERDVAEDLRTDLRNVAGFAFEEEPKETDQEATPKVTPPLPEPTREHFVTARRGATTIQINIKGELENCPFIEINVKENAPEMNISVILERKDKPVWIQKFPKGNPLCKAHFVDKHREDLIHGVHLVTEVLDKLISAQLLTNEHYDYVRSRPTSQEKMRALYVFIRSWSDGDKFKLYEILKDTKKPLIRSLEQADAHSSIHS
ncbi:apoptosis-associated speck-like protein containing a CARD [Pseudophryne corroboree]|uniref:apoptosis-associated speck-like protein containing a CARD n=1 Tax=Pseudophryne corroboree TaxID=495146 RepID=UPI0030817596